MLTMAWDCPRCGREADSFRSYANHFNLKQDGDHEGNALVAKVGCDQLQEMYAELSEKAVAEKLGVARSAVKPALEHCGVDRRGQSEAERRKWANMTEEERQERLDAMSDEFKDKSNGSQALRKWRRENPERARELSKQAAELGTPAREKNGMAGMTGQDNPNWRGGKNILRAVKKQLRPSWWTVRDGARAEECFRCGASDCKLDVHHIVPIMAGGTNEPWNLMTLCDSCHRTAEAFTRQYPGFDPVLAE